MFKINKYSTWYFSIIEKAKLSNRIKGSNEYYERHHIIPRSLGGTDAKNNLVLLTAKEHFICHLLLPNMCINDKHTRSMAYAFLRMSGSNQYQQRHSSRIYSIHKEEMRKKMVGRSHWARLPKSEEHKRKIGAAHKGRKKSPAQIKRMSENAQRKLGEDNSFYGKTHSSETREKISEMTRIQFATKGHPWQGKSLSAEHKATIGAKNSKEWYIESPDGTVTIQKNLSKFCRDNGIDRKKIKGSGYVATLH